jgi:ribonuclease BN (tRNA processing enzyme)
MQLTVIGSADAFNSAGRGNSCYLLESDGAGNIMIDFGPTALAGLRRVQVAPNDVHGVAFTHLHGDHTAGFPLFALDALYASRRESSLSVLGPLFTRDTVDGLLAIMYGDIKDEVSKRLPVEIDELAPGEERLFHGYRVRAFAAEHMALPHRPLCLQFEDPSGRRIAFSGDTRICPGLLAAAQGVDLLVADCSRLAPPAGQHATWLEWQDVLPEIKAKAILFSHLGADAREQLPGLTSSGSWPVPLSVADDGMRIEL